jgi:predicted TIM-barrel fold metal-dependent hydrolase
MSNATSNHYSYLREAIEEISGVSTHDHLKRESQAIAVPTDLFDLIFSSVGWADLVSAGLPVTPQDGIFGAQEYPHPRDYDALWKERSPYLEHVREAATYTTLMRGLQDLFGFDEVLDDSNWRALNDAIRAAQRPGWYLEVLRKRDKVEASFLDMPWTWAGTEPADHFYTCNVMRMHDYSYLEPAFRRLGGVGGEPIETLQDALEAMEARFEQICREGVIAVKMGHAYIRFLEFDDVPRDVAEKHFPRLDQPGWAPRPVQDFLVNETCRLAGERGLPVAFHTGYQYGNSGDIRCARAQLLASLIRRHPRTAFDIFHISYPYCEEAMMLAKYFPNAFFDLCFADFLSPSKIVELLHIGLELLPSNKIFGWGADTGTVEAHRGSAIVTRDCIARCLSERIERGLLTRERGVRLMKKLMRDNAAEAYRLETWRETHPAN